MANDPNRRSDENEEIRPAMGEDISNAGDEEFDEDDDDLDTDEDEETDAGTA